MQEEQEWKERERKKNLLPGNYQARVIIKITKLSY